MKDLLSKMDLVVNILNSVLDQCNMYIGVDGNTSELVFMDEDSYHSGKGKFGRINIDKLNIRD